MTVRILALSDHLKVHRHDMATKRAMNMLVHQRQKMLKYLRRTAPDKYKTVLGKIGLDDIAVIREVR
jgi:small subunit ribosomal protein S15